MEGIKPRFEFRTFAQNFGMVVEKMRKLSPVEKIRESAEVYIMSAGNNENNTKVRDKLMDIKVFVTEKEGLEQWNPLMKGEFPMYTEIIKNDVWPALGVEMPEFKRDEYTIDQYLEEIIRPHKDLAAVNIFKRRFAFTVNNCIAEHAQVYVNGALIETVNLESTEIPDILEGMKMLGVEEYENINYLLAIKRVIGMEPMPK